MHAYISYEYLHIIIGVFTLPFFYELFPFFTFCVKNNLLLWIFILYSKHIKLCILDLTVVNILAVYFLIFLIWVVFLHCRRNSEDHYSPFYYSFHIQCLSCDNLKGIDINRFWMTSLFFYMKNTINLELELICWHFSIR